MAKLETVVVMQAATTPMLFIEVRSADFVRPHC
jgi:hypothetical protein